MEYSWAAWGLQKFWGLDKDVLGFRVASLFQGPPEKEVLQVWETPHIELHPSFGGGGEIIYPLTRSPLNPKTLNPKP